MTHSSVHSGSNGLCKSHTPLYSFVTRLYCCFLLLTTFLLEIYVRLATYTICISAHLFRSIFQFTTKISDSCPIMLFLVYCPLIIFQSDYQNLQIINFVTERSLPVSFTLSSESVYNRYLI